MINGRVERCADNIMRRIVPVRDPRGPGNSRSLSLSLEAPGLVRAPKEISPCHGETCFSTSVFRELQFPRPEKRENT